MFLDVDYTWYDPAAPKLAGEVYAAAVKRDFKVVAVSGVDYQSLKGRAAAEEFPYPEAIIGSVGTELWLRKGDQGPGEYEEDKEFVALLEQSGYDRQSVIARGEKMIVDFAQSMPRAEFRWQRLIAEQEYKASFWFKAATLQQAEAIQREMERVFAPLEVIVSDNTAYNLKHPSEMPEYNADIVPWGKGRAVDYLAEKWEVNGGLIAGDSGNDIDMLMNTSPRLKSLLVAGAKPEVLAELKRRAVKRETKDGGFEHWELKENPEKKLYWDIDVSRRGPESILAAMDVLI